MKISDQRDLESAFRIRTIVFVEEQKVPWSEEIDEFEATSNHYIAYAREGEACGTARWRYTPKGIKLERFAVLKQFRKNGVGTALVKAVLADVEKQADSQPAIYLHAQLEAVPLYIKFGFIKSGDIFEECGIRHIEMIRNG